MSFKNKYFQNHVLQNVSDLLHDLWNLILRISLPFIHDVWYVTLSKPDSHGICRQTYMSDRLCCLCDPCMKRPRRLILDQTITLIEKKCPHLACVNCLSWVADVHDVPLLCQE